MANPTTQDLLASVQRMLQEQGVKLPHAEELITEIDEMTGGATPAPPPKRAPAPARWLTPSDAGVKYSDVWICRNASGEVVLVHANSYRPPPGTRRGERRQKRWYGTDILKNTEVRIVKVLEGSRR